MLITEMMSRRTKRRNNRWQKLINKDGGRKMHVADGSDEM